MNLVRKTASVLSHLCRRRIPGQLVIQITDRCNASCPQCGMRITEKFPRSRLSTDDVKRILDAAARKGVQAVSFTGGEPFLFFDDLTALITHAGNAGIPFLRTGTNGFFLRDAEAPQFRSRVMRIAEGLARTPLRNLWISLDSAVPAVHERMRGLPGVVKGIEKALPIFHAFGIYPAVNLGINRYIGGDPKGKTTGFAAGSNGCFEDFYAEAKEAFRRYYRFAIDLGFTMANNCYPMSVNGGMNGGNLSPVYAASSEDRVVDFSRAEKGLLFRALMEVLPEFRPEIRIFSPLSSLLSLCRQYAGARDEPYPCRGGIDFFFIDAKDGRAYPCGYRGDENLGSYGDVRPGSAGSADPCVLCDWECFRDPSELFGPLLQGVSQPGRLLRRGLRDSAYLRLWAQDLRYYRDCEFFDGRRPPRFERLRRFRVELLPPFKSAAFHPA